MCDRNFLLFLIFVFFLVIIKQTLSEEVEYNIFLCDLKEKCFYGYLESNKIIVISVLSFNKDKNIEYIKFCFFTLVLQILFYLYELHVCQY